MIRIVCRERDARDLAAGASPDPDITYKTFDLHGTEELVELEAWIKAPAKYNDHYVIRTIIGAEVRE